MNAEIRSMNPMNTTTTPAATAAKPAPVTPIVSAPKAELVTEKKSENKEAAVTAKKAPTPIAKKAKKMKKATKPTAKVKAKPAATAAKVKPSKAKSAKKAAPKTAKAKVAPKFAPKKTEKKASSGFAPAKGGFYTALPFGPAATGDADTKDKFAQITREATEKFGKFSESFGSGFSDAVEQSRGSFEAVVESGNITADMGRAFASELSRFANETFSDNVEISKSLFECKTMSDLVDMQNKLFRNNMDHFFNQSDRLSEMFFQFCADAIEPFGQHLVATPIKSAIKSK